MFEVIDTITYRKTWADRYPELAKHDEGLLAILDPNEIKDPPDICGRSVSIHKADGSVIDIVAAHSLVRHSVVAVFFEDASAEDIPRGSKLEW